WLDWFFTLLGHFCLYSALTESVLDDTFDPPDGFLTGLDALFLLLILNGLKIGGVLLVAGELSYKRAIVLLGVEF
ncbi:MAG: hypothetical protein RIG68_24690, partial [Imperialibacter sp.]|uniref:hypothetical protein n=1 Tax=Imperialibacter sp. TaxID=2038411 RepID=UPI0032EB1E18